MIEKYFNTFSESLDISDKAKQSYRQTLFWIKKYTEDCDQALSFKNIDNKFYDDFWKYFVDDIDYSPNTFGKHIKHLKAFMRWAEDNNLHKNRSYRKFRVVNQASNEEALSSREIKRLWEIDLNDQQGVIECIEDYERTKLDYRQRQNRYNNFIKHFYCIAALCSSGMYPTDLSKFKKELIIEGRYVKYKRAKRVNGFKEPWCIIPYVDDDVFHLKTACEKMDYKFDFSKKNLYRDIKIVLLMADIRKKITPRSFRKTFASVWYFERGLELQNCMKMTGHAKEDSFKHYLNVEDDIIIERIMQHKSIGYEGYEETNKQQVVNE